MEERCANDDLEEFNSADDVEASQQTDVEVLEGVTYMQIKSSY